MGKRSIWHEMRGEEKEGFWEIRSDMNIVLSNSVPSEGVLL